MGALQNVNPLTTGALGCMEGWRALRLGHQASLAGGSRELEGNTKVGELQGKDDGGVESRYVLAGTGRRV